MSTTKRVILQGVYELYDKQETTEWEDREERINRLVIIGESLKGRKITQQLSHHNEYMSYMKHNNHVSDRRTNCIFYRNMILTSLRGSHYILYITVHGKHELLLTLLYHCKNYI